MVDKRPGWDQRMIMMATFWSQFSTCLRRHVGAVIFRPDTYAIVGVGYNDTPIGEEDCGEGGCRLCQGRGPVKHLTECHCVHAEMNAIMLAARWGTPIQGCYVATTYELCVTCRKHLKQAGIGGVIMSGEDSRVPAADARPAWYLSDIARAALVDKEFEEALKP